MFQQMNRASNYKKLLYLDISSTLCYSAQSFFFGNDRTKLEILLMQQYYKVTTTPIVINLLNRRPLTPTSSIQIYKPHFRNSRELKSIMRSSKLKIPSKQRQISFFFFFNGFRILHPFNYAYFHEFLLNWICSTKKKKKKV